ncbi:MULTISPECIES: PA domain-containing protein [Haloferax]|uniref:PA domain-containing protein n=1 Tax=Haloferax marinum TaxID=2666143 RepID=A0A6A8G4X4_9EURY|nr:MULTISPECIES: PA domain-containing protein [Haloferax]KAB1197242.1 hypothetical protein Hfx1150_06800 [Haloferax sp. CBA1150]MRW96280.1 hypothetical protein [Haloferax marinum]
MSKNDTNGKSESSSSLPRTSVSRRSILSMLGVGGLGAVGVLSGVASAHPGGVTDDPSESDGHEVHRGLNGHGAPDPSQPLSDLDAEHNSVVSSGPSAHVVKNLALAGRGERLLPNGTTDVWALDGYAYIGTFNTPCGTGAGAGSGELVDDLLGPGITVFDVKNPNKPKYVGSVPSVAGSRTNDVKVANMNSGRILAHSNESCGGGPGGFELYNVDDPLAPQHLAHVQTDDISAFMRVNFGFVDFGVHNLWFFTQGAKDYIAAVVESEFGNFQIFDITDPENPELVSGWGAESLLFPDVDWASTTDFNKILEADAYLFSGYGTSQNRFLHDVTVSEDGTHAYLANWDAGLVLLDISDPANPELVSVAIDPSAGDGEVNSHQAFPNADGSVVVESEEDFNPFSLTFDITSGPNAGGYPVSEGAITNPIADLPDGTMSGPTTYVGLACDAATVPPAPSPDHIAVIQRGVCAFSSKGQNVIDAGYAGMVVFNDEARGDALVTMGGDPIDIPGVFVGHSTGLAILGVADDSGLAVGQSGASVEVESGYGRWGNLRIWDYSNESSPVLASEFDTVCSANPDDESCDGRGTYSVHNIIVEDDMVYISWYSDGVLILDISDPYNPVEVARYSPGGEDFEDQNGGIQDVWGIDKEKNSPWIYASDRNGGLYVLKELGSGSEKRNR